MAPRVRLRPPPLLASGWLAALVLLIGAPMAATASTHPFNETRAEVALNPESGDLEVALGFDALALEEVLTRCGVAPETARIATEGDRQPETVEQYVRSRFSIEQRGSVQPIRWLGQEVEHSSVWVYFVVELESALAGSRWVNELLFELADPDPLNLVILREGSRTHRWVHRRSEAEYVWGARSTSRETVKRWVDGSVRLLGRGLERATRRALASNSAERRRHVRDGGVLLATLLGHRSRLATLAELTPARGSEEPTRSGEVSQSDLRTLLGYSRWLAGGAKPIASAPHRVATSL